MNFKKMNNIVGWVVGIFACLVYLMTAEARGSLWDCGEFVSSCFRIQIPHPPGAPLFVLLGRFFIILFGDNGMTAAKAVNVMSALGSGFAIMFLFWTITHFARRLVVSKGQELSKEQIASIMATGIIGAIAYTFSDSYWYSAVEGEVYATSALCTAVVFWSILKWEHVADEPDSDRWIVFIAFMMGLSVGVHLLNLLTIPAMVMVFYFKRHNTLDYKKMRSIFNKLVIVGGILAFVGALIMASAGSTDQVPMDPTVAGLMIVGAALALGILILIEKRNKDVAKKQYWGGAYIFFVYSVIILGLVQVGVIQETVKVAGSFDIFFVNSLGMPFFTGFTIFFLLLVAVIAFLIRLAHKKGLPFLRLGMWCLAFMLIGYSTYLTTMIRSNADPSIDMFNVDNPLSLAGYLGRDQYGSFPLLYGQKFTAQPADMKSDGLKYAKSTTADGKDAYVPAGESFHYLYQQEDEMVFPRVWNGSQDRGQADYYALVLGIGKDPQTGKFERDPNQWDNLKFYLDYQNYYMFLRYFFWNYVGKQDDVQGRYAGNMRDGNWITGISFIDNMIYGDQSQLPDSLKNSKSHNTMFALPLILGLIGMFYHFKKKKDDALVVFLLFFMTGFAIIMYLNQAGNEPRERDYAYAGATYAFAIWIGLGYFKVKEWFTKAVKNPKTSGIIAFLVCFFAVPFLMGYQEWDDHDRSKKLLAPDLAKDYLESCAPNAILFTFGDNDTYPLWYAQEVEGVRRDIRVINTSLLGIDWYINSLRRKVNESNPVDVIWSADQIRGDKRDVAFYRQNPSIPDGDSDYYDLYDIMKNFVGSDDPSRQVSRGDGTTYPMLPVRHVSVPVDIDLVHQNNTVNANDSVVKSLNFILPKATFYKNDLAMLNIIAANKWKRPIYFTSLYNELGFGQYLRRDGLTYRLVPILNRTQNDAINDNYMYDKVMNKFQFGSANVPGVYFDEENRRHLLTIRQAYASLGLDLALKGDKKRARAVLDKVDKNMLQEDMPYGMVSIGNNHNQTSIMLLQAAVAAEDKPLIEKIANGVRKDLQQQIRYYNSLTGWRADNFNYDKQTAQQMLDAVNQLQRMAAGQAQSAPTPGENSIERPKKLQLSK